MNFLKLIFFSLDRTVQRNFELIQAYLNDQDILKFNLKFTTFSVPVAVTNYAIPHNLGVVPTDIIQTAVSGNITFHYDVFTDKLLYITTDGAASFRGLIGKYKGTIS